MIQLSDISQSTIDASKIVDITLRDKTCGYFYSIRCKLIDENEIRLVYGCKDRLHADYQKLLIATNA